MTLFTITETVRYKVEANSPEEAVKQATDHFAYKLAAENTRGGRLMEISYTEWIAARNRIFAEIVGEGLGPTASDRITEAALGPCPPEALVSTTERGEPMEVQRLEEVRAPVSREEVRTLCKGYHDGDVEAFLEVKGSPILGADGKVELEAGGNVQKVWSVSNFVEEMGTLQTWRASDIA